MKQLKAYPEEIVKNRESLESSFVFCLWKDPSLYDDYYKINDGEDKSILTEDGAFYFSLGKVLYNQGYRNFDNITIYSFLEENGKQHIKNEFERRGGYATIVELCQLVDTQNVDGYYDSIVKQNTLMKLYDQGYNILENIDKFNKMTNQQVYDWYEYQLNDVFINTGKEFKIEELTISDGFLDECNEGLEMGVSYGKNCKIMNGITMGLPLGELTMIGGYSGTGKTSFIFENMILPISSDGVKCAVISNEQRSKDFKILLICHVLTQELNYWELTRKKIKQGNYTEEQIQKLKEAQAIINDKYAGVRFVKLFDNDMGKVTKTIKKLAKTGYQVFMFDTMKSEDTFDEAMWQQLLINSRKLFQLASKENIAIIASYQLALHTLNRRYLDASCLSNAKQIKEVFSEMIYMRQIWDDEFEDESHFIHPVVYRRDKSGKYDKNGVEVPLDRNKKYIVAFVDKTRNDEDKQQVLYEFNGRFNKWKEVGHCKVINDHKW